MPSSGLLTDYSAVQDYLFGLKARGVKYGIERMRALAAQIDHPELKVPVIHLAGTNGKGSTAAMLDSILRQAGKRIGLYTSPHLVKLGERVQVNRQILSENEISQYTAELRVTAEKLAARDPEDHPSFFEFMTAMAFLQFARRNCDMAIVEVGLGGELDATNIVQPAVTAITSIGLDHCEVLGNSHGEIAQAKAGIIKPGIPVVIGRLSREAEGVMRDRAQELDCPIHSIREEFGDAIEDYPQSAMVGDCQRWNAATASLILQALPRPWNVSDRVLNQGLSQVQWPARWEKRVVENRVLVMDASHNPEGAAELALNLARLVQENQRHPVVVVGALGVARAGPLIQAVAQFAREIHLVVPHQARACRPETLRALVPDTFRGKVHHGEVASLFANGNFSRWTAEGETVVVTGSIYLAGEVLGCLNAVPGEGHLQDL